VPDDVSVVGFDDIPMAASLSYELTTVRQPIAEMVESAAEILGLDATDSQRAAPKTRLFKGTLIVRQTVMNRRRILRSVSAGAH
jgi:DNA-binding LacI/PurR family transcriptional regulator